VCNWFLVRYSDSIVKRQSSGKRARGKAVCIEPN